MILRAHDSHACAMHAHGRIIGNRPCSLSLSLALQDSLLTRHHPPKRATTLRRCVGVDIVRHDTLPQQITELADDARPRHNERSDAFVDSGHD